MARLLEEGQSIKVTAGPFADLVGTLERLDEQERVRVLLDILGGKTPVAASLVVTLVASTGSAPPSDPSLSTREKGLL